MVKTKTCAACEKRKSIEQFGVHRRRGQESHRSRCRPCWAEYIRDYRKKNPKSMVKHRKADKARGEHLTRFMQELKTNPCVDCGGRFKPWQMDFDHRPDEEKGFALGATRTYGYSKKRILEEVAKCDLVCANCHRDRTHQRRVAQK